MKLSYIILTESGERLYMGDAWKFNPNEYEWLAGRYGFCYCAERPNDSYCYEPIFDEGFEGDLGECTMARTISYQGFDADGNLICHSSDHGTPFWL